MSQEKKGKEQKDYYYAQSNEQMEFFYSHQPTLMTPEQYTEFIETMKVPLPTTFRLTKND